MGRVSVKMVSTLCGVIVLFSVGHDQSRLLSVSVQTPFAVTQSTERIGFSSDAAKQKAKHTICHRNPAYEMRTGTRTENVSSPTKQRNPVLLMKIAIESANRTRSYRAPQISRRHSDNISIILFRWVHYYNMTRMSRVTFKVQTYRREAETEGSTGEFPHTWPKYTRQNKAVDRPLPTNYIVFICVFSFYCFFTAKRNET